MNVQNHVPGQASGQIPDQMQQQRNGNAIPQQPQNTGNASANRSTSTTNHERLQRARALMREKILAILMKRYLQPNVEGRWIELEDTVKRLEEGLFRSSRSKEEYLNMDTLESRLDDMLRPETNQSQHYQSTVNSSDFDDIIISIPGMSRGVNSNLRAAGISISTMHPNLRRLRGLMQESVLVILMKWNHRPINERLMSKLTNAAKRLEERLFRFSHSKEEYMNMDTLESRLRDWFRIINQNHRD